MSHEELQNNFSFEKKKHFEFFLPYYQEKNWQVIQDNINGACKISWDVELEVFNGRFVKVDEKALRKEYGNFLVELIQDMRTGNLGWFFGEKDWILYGSWENEENAEPASLYIIDSKKLKNYIYGFKGVGTTVISHAGWGITWNIVLEWDDLIINEVAKKLI